MKDLPDKGHSLRADNSSFMNDVLKGLSAELKYLNSKYFYDTQGDILFQKIMASPEYYLTRCEMEILSGKSDIIAEIVRVYGNNYDIVELGAGDASKATHLLREFVKRGMTGNYYPIDISAHIIEDLERILPAQIPGLNVKGYSGEYFEMLKKISAESERPKFILFLGSSIGNFGLEKGLAFCRELSDNLNEGDMVFIGFDLKKHPQIILDAYNDKQGLTRDFNLNLLKRINRELNGNFLIDNFEHYQTYDPGTGKCKSYLVSTTEQEVYISGTKFYFMENEVIFTEISQKYSLEDTDKLAEQSGFRVINKFFDKRYWFTDCLWIKEA